MMLTIIIPIYNKGFYLEKCLNSILSQSYSDFEVILINDGSIDKSGEIAEAYTKGDKRFIYVNQENKGVAMARNVGLALAKGTYIGFVDADDVIEPNMYLNLLNPTLNYDYDIVIAHYKICNKKGQHIIKTNLPINKTLDQDLIKKYILKSYYTGSDPIVPSLCNKIYKRSFLEQYGYKFRNQKAIRASDYWFNFEVFQHAISAYVIEHANYCYNNEVSGSIINSFRENQFIGFLETQKRLLEANEYFKFNIDYNKFYKQFNNNTNQFILNAISSKGNFKGYKFVKPILKNNEFRSSFKQITIKKIHMKSIAFFMNFKLIIFTYMIYCIWHLRFKK